MNDDTALVQSGKFDLLVQKIEQKKMEMAQYEVRQQKLRIIFRRITSVYFFLTEKMDMPRIDLSLEDFETAEEKLNELAKEKTKSRWYRFLAKFGIETAWQYYYKFGFFHHRRTPFGYWFFIKGYDSFNFDDFDAEYTAVNYNGRAIPPNAPALLHQIYEKEFGSQIKSND